MLLLNDINRGVEIVCEMHERFPHDWLFLVYER